MRTERSRIIVCGEPVELASGVKCITYEDPGGFSFYRKSRSTGDITRKLLYNRIKKGGGAVKTLSELQEKVYQVVLHTDCTGSSRICFDVLVNRGLSTHFLIDWDGTIYQAADIRDKAIHGGPINGVSIGIDLNNRMPLFRPGDPIKSYESFLGSRFAKQFVDPAFKRPLSEFKVINITPKRSYGYTDAQYTALTELLKVLSLQLPGLSNYKEGGVPQPPVDETGAVLNRAMEAPLNWHGVLGHYHISAGKWDPGPGFDWERVFHALRGEDNFFPVNLAGKEGRSGLTMQQMRQDAEAFYQNIENGNGGFFPVGIQQQWHGGVHIRTTRGEGVRAMLTGTVVAARMTRHPALGSSNFVLLKHSLPMPREGDDPESPTRLTLYSLYMHLEDPESPIAGDTPQWMQRASKKEPEENRDGGLSSSQNSGLGTKEEMDRPFNRIGYGSTALQRGDVALFPVSGSDAIRVGSGEVLGFVGEFGSGLDRDNLVHIEFFADDTWKEAIDLSLHGQHFVQLGEETGRTLRVTEKNVLALMKTGKPQSLGRRGFLFPSQDVSRGDIERFYQSETSEEAKVLFRKAISRHVSEWSDQVDWMDALSGAQEWSEKVQDMDDLLRDDKNRYREGIFSSELRNILPFIWLTKEVAEHIGLQADEWTGSIYHFHPIHFVQWLSFHSSNRVRVISKGKSRKALLADLERSKKRLEIQRLNDASGRDQGPDGEELLDESLELDEVLDGYNPEEKLDRLRKVRLPGKWQWSYPREED